MSFQSSPANADETKDIISSPDFSAVNPSPENTSSDQNKTNPHKWENQQRSAMTLVSRLLEEVVQQLTPSATSHHHVTPVRSAAAGCRRKKRKNLLLISSPSTTTI